MTPREALNSDLEEPGWRARFAEYLQKWPANFEEYAFEEVLTDWRRFHATPIEGSSKRLPAPAVDGVVALANLGITPPRSLLTDIPRGGPLHEIQHDDHCWLFSFADGRAWRIETILDGTMHLDSFGDKKEIELAKVDWAKYVEMMKKWLTAAPA